MLQKTVVKFATILAAVTAVFLLQVYTGVLMPFKIDFMLATLFILSLSSSFGELVIAALWAAYLLDWPLSFGGETTLVFILPIASWFLARKFFRFNMWTNVVLASVGGVAVFYLLLSPKIFVINLSWILADLAIIVPFAFAFYGLWRIKDV